MAVRLEGQPVGTKYFIWLYNQVCPILDVNSPRSYAYVCDRMHQTPFKVMVARDENRRAEASELRRVFREDSVRLEPLEVSDLLFPDVSVLEVLVALALRMEFMIDISPQEAFRLFLDNLKLSSFTDEYCRTAVTTRVDRIIHTFNDRTYTARGYGGLFPIQHPESDQRTVELWYQMGEYMTENRMY